MRWIEYVPCLVIVLPSSVHCPPSSIRRRLSSQNEIFGYLSLPHYINGKSSRMRSFWILALAFPIMALGQSRQVELSGRVTDTEGQLLAMATLLVLDPVDTTLITYGMTNEKGEFRIPRVPRGRQLVKVTYVGFMPLLLEADPGDEARLDMGSITLEAIAQDLFEVVVREAKAPMSIRGDTIEYDASKFKVPPGATVEDLLRRLPGMEVNPDGSILSGGQEVRRVTVDGRRFFGDDPRNATKNLPAAGISKVQVYSNETEEQKLTGVRSTAPEKSMNLELKDDFKKGGFGKVIAGGGTMDRAELKGNYNRFSPDEQFSLIGIGNNTGRNGMGWDDYQDFRGSEAMNWSDEADFGFSSGVYSVSFGPDTEDIFQRGSFFSGRQNGLPRNGSAGVNYSRFSDRTEFNAVYFFNHGSLFSEAASTRDNFLPTSSFFNREQTRGDQFQNAHQAIFRLEHEIDTFQTLILNGNASLAYRDVRNSGNNAFFTGEDRLTTATEFRNSQRQDDLGLNGSVLYRRSYHNEGRRSAASLSYGHNQAQQLGEQISESGFYNPMGLPDSLAALWQDTDTRNRRGQVRANLLHVEPLSQRFFIQTFYNFSSRRDHSDRDVADLENGSRTDNDFLSRYYVNRMDLHRLGSGLRYSHRGINATLGMAGQRYLLDGELQSGPTAGIDTAITRRFDNLLPNLNINASLIKNQYLSLNYAVNAREPSIRNLQPIVDNSNPLFIREGNPDLIPQIDHAINGYFYKSSPLRFTSLNINAGYVLSEQQFVQDQTVDSLLVTTSRTINYRGGRRLFTGANYSFPVVKNRWTINLGYNFNLQRQYALVNAVENETRNMGHGANLRMNLTPSEFFVASLSARIDVQDIRYSLQSSQDQLIFNQNYSLNLSTRLLWSVYLHTNFSYDRFRNDRFGFDQDLPVLLASLSRVFPPADRWEARLSVYDIFNRNRGISQFASGNVVSESRSLALTRYAMFSLTYNLRGVSTKLKPNSSF